VRRRRNTVFLLETRQDAASVQWRWLGKVGFVFASGEMTQHASGDVEIEEAASNEVDDYPYDVDETSFLVSIAKTEFSVKTSLK